MNLQKITDKALVKLLTSHQEYIDERNGRIRLYVSNGTKQREVALALDVSTRMVAHVLHGR